MEVNLTLLDRQMPTEAASTVTCTREKAFAGARTAAMPDEHYGLHGTSFEVKRQQVAWAISMQSLVQSGVGECCHFNAFRNRRIGLQFIDYELEQWCCFHRTGIMDQRLRHYDLDFLCENNKPFCTMEA